MPLCRNRAEALEQMQRVRENNVSMAIFCTASHWNTEAIIKAADDFARDNGIDCLPLTVAITFNYPHMQQAQRVTYSKKPELGLLSLVEFVKLLCGSEYSPYKRVMPLLHLDHASPKFDEWALYKGVEYLNSVMFDAQLFPLEENVRLTSEYVERFGNRVLVEGIMDELSVLGEMKAHDDDSYVPRAVDYVSKTGVDFLVADLGTEQQSAAAAGTFSAAKGAGPHRRTWESDACASRHVLPERRTDSRAGRLRHPPCQHVDAHRARGGSVRGGEHS